MNNWLKWMVSWIFINFTAVWIFVFHLLLLENAFVTSKLNSVVITEILLNKRPMRSMHCSSGLQIDLQGSAYLKTIFVRTWRIILRKPDMQLSLLIPWPTPRTWEWGRLRTKLYGKRYDFHFLHCELSIYMILLK